ncbi:hypothetical protein [Yoonia sediminilitoris]|uniref:hypothetical protein n=1 Tax=Yoonia sediminilitoris TaxID=1286148 RepID=UPI0014556531|nr:hypothetical protein [Yoonia sediminilitoris]
MWNRTGLPAVFPLQFKTPLGGSDYLTVIDSVTGEPILGHLCMAGRFSGCWCPA